jgi:hypothetical protein
VRSSGSLCWQSCGRQSSGVRRCSRRSGAFLSFGLKFRIPRRAKVALMRSAATSSPLYDAAAAYI